MCATSDPFGQTYYSPVLPWKLFCFERFWKVRTVVRTDSKCKNSDYYRPWSWVGLVDQYWTIVKCHSQTKIVILWAVLEQNMLLLTIHTSWPFYWIVKISTFFALGSEINLMSVMLKEVAWLTLVGDVLSEFHQFVVPVVFHVWNIGNRIHASPPNTLIDLKQRK